MPSKLIVLYKKPADPAHFDKYFRETHMPLVKKMPGLKSFFFGPASDLEGKDGEYFWQFTGTFDSLKAIGEAFGSPEGQAALADIPNYSKEAPTVLHIDATEG